MQLKDYSAEQQRVEEKGLLYRMGWRRGRSAPSDYRQYRTGLLGRISGQYREGHASGLQFKTRTWWH